MRAVMALTLIIYNTRLSSHDDAPGHVSTSTTSSLFFFLFLLILCPSSLFIFLRILHTKSCKEEDLLEAAESGNLTKMRWLLDSCKPGELNIEYTDQLGRTPLHLAVVNEHKEVVRFLLDLVSHHCLYKVLLAAINIGNEEIAEIIIEHPKYANISSDLKSQNISSDVRGSSTNITDDNQFFEEETSRDELKFARSRLNAYRGMSSEAYISLSSDDPILTSFKLRKEIQQAEYSALANQLSEYAVKLLDKVHGNEELNAILNARDGQQEDGDETSGGELARLQLAIKYKEKKVPLCVN
ncbi:hypothetical protein HELRODRAFT_169550 [Helobdella robusta]|uniref:Transient receptor ion channel domain-containing protein n=1 Tax=Helobdella robusta TaxID=6412 RepID=T1F232_HELRO|nr:hypothetical protein HELRODRAFT_169550 [Helobdella robusta]ESO08662.1 hypothetical protein HELRODRAFT_169550 [Helobdella robusta]